MEGTSSIRGTGRRGGTKSFEYYVDIKNDDFEETEYLIQFKK